MLFAFGAFMRLCVKVQNNDYIVAHFPGNCKGFFKNGDEKSYLSFIYGQMNVKIRLRRGTKQNVKSM